MFTVFCTYFYAVLHGPLDTMVFSLFSVHTVLCSVACTFGHTGVFRVFFVNMFYVVLHAPLGTLVFSVFFLYFMFDAVLHGLLDTLTFSIFVYTLFDAL